MGYWSTNETGESFADSVSGEDMVWGDQPADILDAALDEIALTFLSDAGRLPSKKELLAGIYFSLGGPEMLTTDLPDSVEEAVLLTTPSPEQEALVEANYYQATDTATYDGAVQRAAWETLRPVLKGLQQPFRDRNEAEQERRFHALEAEAAKPYLPPVEIAEEGQ